MKPSLAVLVPSLLLAPLALPAARAGTTCNSSWSVVPGAALLESHEIHDLAAIAPDDVWAVGRVTGISLRSLRERWNGVVWLEVPGPDGTRRDTDLNGVAAVRSDDVWAVGTTSDGGTNREAHVQHRNGTQWTVVAIPARPDEETTLAAVAAAGPGDVWAVGASISATLSRTFVVHWDGASWSEVSGPDPAPGGRSWLAGVAASAPGDVWAVGGITAVSGVDQTLAEHWDGTSWTVVPSPSFDPFPTSLASVAASAPADVWAVGWASVQVGPLPAVDQTYVMHWDGTAWPRVTSPNLPPIGGREHNHLFDVAAPCLGDATAAGNWEDAAGRRHGLVQHADSGAWCVVATPDSGARIDDLFAVAAVSGDELWVAGRAAGGSGSAALFLHVGATSPGGRVGNHLFATHAGADVVLDWSAGAFGGRDYHVHAEAVKRDISPPSSPQIARVTGSESYTEVAPVASPLRLYVVLGRGCAGQSVPE